MQDKSREAIIVSAAKNGNVIIHKITDYDKSDFEKYVK